MPMHTAYGFSRSGNCWKVRQILELTGTPFQWVEVDTNGGETRIPAYLALNPNGKAPIIVLDGGEVVTESNAILLHVAEGSRYLPPPGLARTRVHEWLFFEQYSHEPYIAVARNWITYLKAKDKYADRLPEIWERGYKALDVMERRLATQDFLTDAGFSIADIALFAYTHMADEGEFDLAGYPGIRAWLRRVAGAPGIRPIRPVPV
jgi:glutathione S-transferase